MIHKGRRERVKERFLQEGDKSFADHEILELLLYYSIPQKDTNELAHNLIKYFNSLSEVLEADYQDLMNVDGVGPNTALLIKLILPIYSSYLKSKFTKKISLNTLYDLGLYCFSLVNHERSEVLYCISLNANYEVLGKNLIEKGSNTDIIMYPKKIVESALRFNAVYVVLCHNHPSGNYLPSNKDEQSTLEIDKLFDMLDIKLIDHIIVFDQNVYSMKNRELIQNINMEI